MDLIQMVTKKIMEGKLIDGSDSGSTVYFSDDFFFKVCGATKSHEFFSKCSQIKTIISKDGWLILVGAILIFKFELNHVTHVHRRKVGQKTGLASSVITF